MGAKCIVIHKELTTQKCPLPNNVCFFKHTVSGNCKARNIDGMTASQLAELVGRKPISDEQYKEIYEKLKQTLL